MTIIKSLNRHRILKRTLIIGIILAVGSILLHLWFKQNAKTILKEYVSSQSGGKIELELSTLDVSLFTNRLQVNQGQLSTTDTLNESMAYRAGFSKLSLKIGSFWDLLLRKRLIVDSLKIYDPVIRVTRLKKGALASDSANELSIPEEMGKVYNSLLSALDEFSVKRILIDNASIMLSNKTQAGSAPVTVSNIFFDLLRRPVKTGNSVVYVNDQQTLVLRSSNQNIELPGSRHRLAFKSFRLRLFRQSIELDSCTIIANPTDSLKSNYKIFFKKLKLTGVDFAALSAKNLIKADTVFCESPFFDFNLYRSDALTKNIKAPDPDKLIRSLTGNLNLGVIKVKNAGIHFDINGDKKRSFFNSNKDNFEIIGFRINPDSSELVSIRQFNMTLRGYRLYNQDSSSSFGFDSLKFLNNKIVLSNFGILTKPGISKQRNDVDIKIPYFELSNLDWYGFVFEQNIVAGEAFLKNPVINFTRNKTGNMGRKFDLFGTLLNLDSLVALEKVSMVNGQVKMQLGKSTSFDVQNIGFKIYSNKLLGSSTKEGLRNAVEYLSFSDGLLRLKDITAQLKNARFTGNNLLYADKVLINGAGDKIASTVNKVYIDNMQLDDDADTISVDGLRWESADVALKALPAVNNEEKGNIQLKNVHGKNTRFNFSSGPITVSTYIKALNALSLVKEGNDLVRVNGFNVDGNDLSVKSNFFKASADSYRVAGDSVSSLTDVRVMQLNGKDSLTIQSPSLRFLTDLNEIFASDLHLASLEAISPVIKLVSRGGPVPTSDSSAFQLPVRIDKLTLLSSDLNIASHQHDSVSVFSIPRSDSGKLLASGITISADGTQVKSLVVNASSATFVQPAGDTLGIKSGIVDIKLSDISFGKKDGKTNWSGLIDSLYLQGDRSLSAGILPNRLSFTQASLGNVNVSSAYVGNISQLIKSNVSAWLRVPGGQFSDSTTTMKWYNAVYDSSSGILNFDSLDYHPTQPLDTILARVKYQLDYITLKSGPVSITGLDLANFENDSTFIADTIKINKPVLTVYRDKKPPHSPGGKYKPLPVKLLQELTLPVSVGGVLFEDGTITYSERNAKSRKTGTFFLSNVNGSVDKIQNRDLMEEDSLSLIFNARLMDAAALRLSLKQSYTDSLNKFFLNAHIGATDLKVFNPVLAPLSNVKVASGILDSVSIVAIGREDIALGEMIMHYRKLRIKLIKNGDPDQSSFLRNLASFVANTFIIRSNNNRKGIIYYKHSGEQSFVNYIIKLSLSGIPTSIGLKHNRRYMRDYKKELKETNMPQVRKINEQ